MNKLFCKKTLHSHDVAKQADPIEIGVKLSIGIWLYRPISIIKSTPGYLT